MLIPEFFNNQVIFITGATGFIGKTLIEKLLRCCHGIAKIYILIRVKRGKTADERLEELLKEPCYRQLWKERPEVFNKIETIQGDSSKLNLGICPNDIKRLRDVSIIFHSAASVRFDEPLREAILMNVRGVHELMKIAANLKNLIAYVHISTTYSNPAVKVVHEKIFTPTVDWRDIVKIAENVDPDMLDILTAKIHKRHPNTYTFSKHLAEQIVFDYKDKMPVAIFRPAIVISALKEPIPGWIDNLNGPIATLVACGVGIKRSDLCEPDTILSMVPVDIVIRGLIVAVYKLGMRSTCSRIQTQVEVYNCALDETAPFTIRELINTGERVARKIPCEKCVWLPGGIMHRHKPLYLLQVLFQQVPFAMLLDGLLRLNGKKPKVVKLQRTMVNASKALQYFMFNTWIFKTDKFFELDDCVSTADREQFGFLKQCYFSYEDFYPDLIYGLREFLLKEPREPTSAAKKRLKIFIVLHYALQGTFSFWFLRILYRRIIL